MKNGASSLLWFASLQFPFHSVQAVVCARHCENTLTIFSGFGDLFSYVLNLIFFSFFFLLRLYRGFSYFSFHFFSPLGAFVDTLSRWSLRCDVLCMSFLVDWSGKSNKEMVSSERSYTPRNAHWWQCWLTTIDGKKGWRGWDSEKNVRFLSSRSLNEEQSFCFLQWWVIWSTSHCMKKFAILIKISSLSTNHYKILMKIGRFRFPVWIFVSFHFYAHLQNHITMKGQLALSPQKVTE